MKKVILGILAAAILLSASATAAFAFGARAGCNFVDADGDGVCDMADSHCAFVDVDGDGVCDNVGSRRAFVDADGDGICDNAAFPQRRGCGFGHGGHGCGFRGGRCR